MDKTADSTVKADSISTVVKAQYDAPSYKLLTEEILPTAKRLDAAGESLGEDELYEKVMDLQGLFIRDAKRYINGIADAYRQLLGDNKLDYLEYKSERELRDVIDKCAEAIREAEEKSKAEGGDQTVYRDTIAKNETKRRIAALYLGLRHGLPFQRDLQAYIDLNAEGVQWQRYATEPTALVQDNVNPPIMPLAQVLNYLEAYGNQYKKGLYAETLDAIEPLLTEAIEAKPSRCKVTGKNATKAVMFMDGISQGVFNGKKPGTEISIKPHGDNVDVTTTLALLKEKELSDDIADEVARDVERLLDTKYNDLALTGFERNVFIGICSSFIANIANNNWIMPRSENDSARYITLAQIGRFAYEGSQRLTEKRAAEIRKACAVMGAIRVKLDFQKEMAWGIEHGKGKWAEAKAQDPNIDIALITEQRRFINLNPAEVLRNGKVVQAVKLVELPPLLYYAFCTQRIHTQDLTPKALPPEPIAPKALPKAPDNAEPKAKRGRRYSGYKSSIRTELRQRAQVIIRQMRAGKSLYEPQRTINLQPIYDIAGVDFSKRRHQIDAPKVAAECMEEILQAEQARKADRQSKAGKPKREVYLESYTEKLKTGITSKAHIVLAYVLNFK